MTFATRNIASEKLEKGRARHPMSALRRFAAGALLGSALLGGAALAAPTTIPFNGQEVDLTVREQPLEGFLQAFFGPLNIPVSVSSSVKGTVNGTFRGPADQQFDKITKTLGLIPYYDGTIVYVYMPSEIITRVFQEPAGGAEAVLLTVRQERMIDERNTLRIGPNNTLIATGTKRFIDKVAEIANPPPPPTPVGPSGFRVYYLRYAWANDVELRYGGKTTLVPGVASILRSLLTSSRSGGRGSALIQSQGTDEQSLRNDGLARQQGNSTLGLRSAGMMAPSAETVQQAWANRPGGVQGSMDAQLLDSLKTAAAMAAEARVEADARLNAVIVRDAPGRLPYYDELVKSLDMEPQALEIEATIIELSSNKMRELGINWRGTGNRYSFLFGDGIQDSNGRYIHDSLLDPFYVRPEMITPGGAGGSLSLVLGGNVNKFAARINALQDQGVARIVTSPQVMTLSNVEAVIDNNRSFYIKVNGNYEVDLFKVTAGTTLRVTPHVFREGSEVHIKLLVQIDDGVINFTDTASKVDNIPSVSRSTINTQALLMAGESLLIGGIVQDSERNNVSKVPLLGDIPILGNLFKTTTDNHDRVERLFLISPRLIPARRTLTSPVVPIGPQRPGSAVEPPPMPKYPTPEWVRGSDSPESSPVQPAPNMPSGEDPGSSIHSPEPLGQPALNMPPSGDADSSSIRSFESSPDVVSSSIRSPEPPDQSAFSAPPPGEDANSVIRSPEPPSEQPAPSDSAGFSMPSSGDANDRVPN